MLHQAYVHLYNAITAYVLDTHQNSAAANPDAATAVTTTTH